jgi:RIP metalloprotease RseP
VSETLPPMPPPAGGIPDPWQGPAHPAEESSRSFGDRLAASKILRVAVLVGVLGYAAYVSIWLFTIIMALAGCIFMHELGHYLVAKRAGMKVTEFFIGFGPRIWSFQRGETEYGIKLIWLGAYVKIIGMSNLDEIAPEDEARSYRAQSFGKRMPVVLAGPVMNLLLGFLMLLVVIVGFGKPSETQWKVSAVTVGSAAEQAGLQPGDRIVAFEGQDVTDFESLTSLVRAHAGTTVDLTVERDGEQIAVPATLGWSLTADSAAQLGLNPSDRVTEVNGVALNTYADLVAAMQNAQGPVTLTYVRERKTASHEVTGPIELSGDAYKGFLGVGPATVYESVPLGQSVGDAASEFGTIVVGSVQGMGKVFSPTGLSNLFHQVTTATDETSTASGSSGSSSGSSTSSSSTATASSNSSENADRPMSIVGIANIGTQIGEEAGWAGVLALLAVVNIFLGLINLAPLLPLDGGHIVVACYEEIRSRIGHTTYRVNMAKLMPVTYVVFLLIAGLALSTIYLDVAKPISIK